MGDIILTNQETNTDEQGYVRYSNPVSFQANEQLFDEAALFDLSVTAGLIGGAYDDGAGCNISFDFLANFDWNIPGMDFLQLAGEFDTSFFDKVDMISLEFTMINDMLIQAILDMECCDIAKTYNTTLVPFFQFFADSNHGGFMEMLVRYAEVITMLRAVIEPLECLVRLSPGNPWFYADVDFLAWIYGYYKESGPFLNKIMSGELLDIVLNPVHDIRVKMQACLAGDTSGDYMLDILDIGSQPQLEAISRLAISDGKPLKDAGLPPPKEPAKPQPGDYPNGEADPAYLEAMKAYDRAVRKYNRDQTNYKIVQEEIQRQSKMANDVTPSLAVSAQTHSLIKIHTNGLCGCVANALGLKNSIEVPIPVRTTQDVCNNLQGKTIKGVTNKEAGTTSKNRPKDEPLTVEQGDCEKTKTKEAIVNAGQHKGQNYKAKITTTEKKVSNPYKGCPGAPGDDISCKVPIVTKQKGANKPSDALKNNDENVKLMQQAVNQTYATAAKKAKAEKEAEINHEKKRREAMKLINEYSDQARILVEKASAATTTQEKEMYELAARVIEEDIKAAWAAFDLYLATFIPFDFKDDPYDQLALSKYISEGFFEGPSINTFASTSMALNNKITDTFNLNDIPFTPNTPPQNIVNRLDTATDVKVDDRFQVNYFNSGFVREKGSSSWRNFNPLDLSSEIGKEYGAIGVDRSDINYKAIFPNDTLGMKAMIDYIKDRWNLYILDDFIREMLVDKSYKNIEEFSEKIIDKYGWDIMDTQVYMLSAEELTDLILDIREVNGYEEGKLWVKTRRTDSGVLFTYEYENETSRIFSNGEELIGSDILMAATNDSDLARQVAQISNNAIAERGHKYVEVKQLDEEEQGLHQVQNDIYDIISNNLASLVPTETDLLIPCTCNNFLCMLLNAIIQYVLEAFNRLIQEIIDLIIKFLIPDWVRDLLQLIFDMLKCFMSIFGIFATIAEIHEYAEDLLDAMRDRIRYYPDDPCFIPPDPFDYERDKYDGYDWDDGGDGYGEDDGGDDGNPGDGFFPPNIHRPPVVYPPYVLPDGGQRGSGPAFAFTCDYLDI